MTEDPFAREQLRRPDAPLLSRTAPGGPGGPPADSRMALVETWGAPALGLLAALLWILGVRTVLPSEMGSLGLLPALPALVLASYPLLLAAVVIELLRGSPRTSVLSVLTMCGVVGVYGLQPATQEIARLPVAWLHVGFADYIAEHGDVYHLFDARFSWSGFFTLIAFVTDASGSPNGAALAKWAPVLLAGLGALGIRALSLAVLNSQRASWLATWVFLLVNWTEQDYFSPQGTAFVMMVAALAVVLWHLTLPMWTKISTRTAGPEALPGTADERFYAVAVVVLIAAGLAPTHQLTPYMLAWFLVVLLLARKLQPVWLPVLAVLPALLWFTWGAQEYWLGNLAQVTAPVGDVANSVRDGILNRFVGDLGRHLVLIVRIGLTMTVLLLGVIGAWRLRKQGASAITLLALGVAPFALAVVQPYGGEVFMRCYLFSLPFLSILAGVVLKAGVVSSDDRHGGPERRFFHSRAFRATAVWAGLVGLCAAVLLTRGGNDAYTSFSSADLDASRFAYASAKPGQRIEPLTPYVPFGYQGIGDYGLLIVDGRCPSLDRAYQCVLDGGTDFLIVTPSEEAYGQIVGGLPAGWTDRLVAQLVATGKYRVMFDERGSRVVTRISAMADA